MRCPVCDATARDGAAFCPDCGASLSGLDECATCGASLSPGASFCRECGARVSTVRTEGPANPLVERLGSRGMLVAIAASLLFLVLAVAGLFVFILTGGDDEDDIGVFTDPDEVEDTTVASIQESIDSLGPAVGDTERDQMRAQVGQPDGFAITRDVDEAGNATRREEWFYYEIRTVFEFADGKLVSNLPIESSYGQFYIAAIQYDPDDFTMGATWEEVSGLLADPGAFSRYELEPEYELPGGHFYVGEQLLLLFDDDERLIYLEALPLAPGEEIQ